MIDKKQKLLNRYLLMQYNKDIKIKLNNLIKHINRLITNYIKKINTQKKIQKQLIKKCRVK